MFWYLLHLLVARFFDFWARLVSAKEIRVQTPAHLGDGSSWYRLLVRVPEEGFFKISPGPAETVVLKLLTHFAQT